MPASAGSVPFQSGTRPRPGRIDATPQACAGCLSEPPRSVPVDSGLMPAATDAAAPPLEPPGVRSAFHGFAVAPYKSLVVSHRQENSGVFVRPSTTTPASSQFCTHGELTAATLSCSAAQPFTVAQPARS